MASPRKRPTSARAVVRLILVGILLQLLFAGSSSAQVCSELELLYDALNCGTCGNDCSAGSLNSNWSCEQGQCQFQGCEAGFFDTDGDDSCEYACAFVSADELCNDIDDDCDGQIDEGISPPPTSIACGVDLAATSPECTTDVTLACVQGTWECTFPANVCVGGCSSEDEICDLLDNDCDGSLNENVANYGLACTSDQGLPPPGHGRCATAGVYECSGPTTTVCSASQADCADLPGGCTELCDGVDNDCDGLVDESYSDPGTEPAYFVRPEVTQYAVNRWMFSYEASRPGASSTQPGYGNGYHCSGFCGALPPAPADTVLDQTVACSVPDHIPWANVTPIEVEQVCEAIGGFVCDNDDYQTACRSTAGCDWGYSPLGAACGTPFTTSKYCNLSVSFDFDEGTPGDQFGVLVTASPELMNCGTDWGGSFPGNQRIFDTTGNLREIAKVASNVYSLMGGSYLTEVEAGAACDFDFFLADQTYRHRDAGFRCCFAQDPGL